MSTAHQEIESTTPSTPQPVDTGSPEGSPPAMAIRPSSLANAKAACKRAREISIKLRKEFDALSREVEPELEPDEEKPEPNPQASLQLATLGIALASKEKEAIQLEREVVNQEQNAGVLQPQEAEKRLQDLNRRHLSAGDDLWKHKKKKARYNDPGTVRLLEPRANALTECILALYRKSDNQSKAKSRPSNWRRDALAYYTGSGDHHPPNSKDMVWCHVSGMWHPSKFVKTAHIVPNFFDGESIGEILFGSRAESLERAGNALLMSYYIKKWFDSYHLVIVPFEKGETPIKRWRVDVISSSIQNTMYTAGHTARELHGKELMFLNDKRPVSRFLYFHFIMALIRIKDLNCDKWRDIWARYYEVRPFPTPGNYMRRSMLLALASHYSTTDLDVVDSWLKDNGFETPLQLTKEEATEAARRVHAAVEAAISRADKQSRSKSKIEDVSESNSSEDED
ncbi:hypothetical protein CT0861_11765 [Colletotrichum tofieldiae]|uniref:HNH nuclease domain-containing protein n=1 Tax=Colletotrichum tofieldiae TaxID=708197 RepID=A0A161Y4F6_9PEZI|nr:hypothetical protein CT0861_11765 [Colletotrichum tofieldiae]GKT97716.1 hypothetical protein Ct61P_15566 [Colletotrichum tofieldiae]